MGTKKIMFLGTASSVGKSTVATAFCRYFKRKGYNVAPFKALNISLNSFVTKDGDEIGRAQVVQAEACEIEPKEYMNPVLMKPSAGYKTQVIVRGKVHCTMDAYKYRELNPYLRTIAKEAFDDISKDYDVIVLEGSGSCAEINLKDTDIANMKMAEMADAPVILVADISKGGVFASIVGTIMLLDENERSRVKGVIINKFRGRKELFEGAMRQIEDIIHIPVLGVMPHVELDIEEEDAATENIRNTKGQGVDVAVIRLPHMSNFTDFNSLGKIKNVNVRYVENPKDLSGAHMIIIPGSKNTIDDLNFVKNSRFKEALVKAKEDGMLILGVCGGYQILGKRISDLEGVEGEPRVEEGLGFLDMETTFNKIKNTRQIKGIDCNGNEITGYEIHNGESSPLCQENIWIKGEDGKVLGMKSPDGRVLGTYIHGLFDEGDFALKLVNEIKEKLNMDIEEEMNYREYKMMQYDKLCDILEENINMNMVEEILEQN
ncbi:cobyric acid synthase [Clostridium cadaveris]|uniref:cobyric acid synthase n=1 Tax=Clostridium cadaveris TaxID=1529 RepID=UPI001E4540CB|nr:cobyric acid synthase [Clostridium cadaveris]UFH64853.1 cobyric acid synthase [Clostridium cadaveris]